jgi:hypothetical protein
MKTWRHILLYLVCLPADLVGWSIVLFARLAWGEKLTWETPKSIGRPGGPVLTCDLREDSWPVTPGKWPKGFYLQKTERQKGSHPHTWGGTTFGHAIFYGPGRRGFPEDPWEPIQVHEHVHVEQFEAAMLRSALVGLVVALGGQTTLGLVIWCLGYVLMLVASWVTAILRGEDPYRGSHHEEAAYAIDEVYERK